jgi:hypothetical protein
MKFRTAYGVHLGSGQPAKGIFGRRDVGATLEALLRNLPGDGGEMFRRCSGSLPEEVPLDFAGGPFFRSVSSQPPDWPRAVTHANLDQYIGKEARVILRPVVPWIPLRLKCDGLPKLLRDIGRRGIAGIGGDRLRHGTVLFDGVDSGFDDLLLNADALLLRFGVAGGLPIHVGVKSLVWALVDPAAGVVCLVGPKVRRTSDRVQAGCDTVSYRSSSTDQAYLSWYCCCVAARPPSRKSGRPRSSLPSSV